MGLTRRRLLAGTVVVAGGGLVLALGRDSADELRLLDDEQVLEPNAYLQISAEGGIVLQVDKLEMGQGVWTGFVTLLAEELRVRPEQIAAGHAPVHPHFQTPMQVTAESSSMRSRFDRIRLTGAAAREMLREAAARRWQLEPAAVELPGDATLRNSATGETLRYGELAEEAAALPVPDEPPLTAAAEFQWIGATVPRVDIPDKVNGRARFGSDVRLPDMLTAMVLRPPRAGDSLMNYSREEALAQPGVHSVLEISAGIAVVADSFWSAQQGLKFLRAEWRAGPLEGFAVQDFREEQRERLRSGDGKRAVDEGDVDAALQGSGRVLDAEYTTPFVAHMTMETMNATVRLGADSCEIWSPVQAPDLARQVACDLTGLRRDQVTVHTTLAGSGFGRRALMDYVAEAVSIAKQLDRPVQLLWSREDDLHHDYYRGATTHWLRGGLGETGELLAWDHQLVAPDLSEHILPTGFANLAPEWVPRGTTDAFAALMRSVQLTFMGPYQSRDGAVSVPYASENGRVTLHAMNPPLPVGIWRSVGNSYNVFAVECFVDELAHAAGIDPAEYRRRQMADRPRHLAVLERLLSESGWGNTGPDRYQGIAIHHCFDSVVGQVAEISVSAKQIRVHRICCVVDCGVAINPDNVKAQLEGAILFGLNAALNEELQVENGYVTQSNFHDYPMSRLAGTPVIDTHIIESGEPPGGIGETGTPGVAPAVANAVFAATGRRLRSLPLRLG